MTVERTGSIFVAAPPPEVFAHLDELGRYPAWTDLVARAEPAPPDPGGEPAWTVYLRGRVGPLSRWKRLRMVRTHHDPSGTAVFERVEADGRQHATWRLTAEVRSEGDGSAVTMTFRYGGRLWGPLVERLLGDEIDRSSARLAELVTGH